MLFFLTARDGESAAAHKTHPEGYYLEEKSNQAAADTIGVNLYFIIYIERKGLVRTLLETHNIASKRAPGKAINYTSRLWKELH